MLDPSEVDSNIVIFKVDPNWGLLPNLLRRWQIVTCE